MNMSRILATLISAGAVAFAQPAAATVIGGGITGGSALSAGGLFVKLSVPFPSGASNPDNTVGNNTFQTPNLYAFDEDQNILLTSEIVVDVGTNPAAGGTVASHYVFFDPLSTLSQIGYVDFDSAIYGVATSTSTLAASDFLANTGVTYLNPGLRGLEGGDSVSIDPLNPNRLLVDWTASTPGDYVRVFTDFSPAAAVSETATLGLYAGGLLAAVCTARRRRQQAWIGSGA